MGLVTQSYFKILSKSGDYKVHIGKGVLDQFLSHKEEEYLIICDDKLVSLYLKEREFNVIPVEASEASKDIDNISKVILDLRKYKANRKTHIIAIGGGVMQDLSCFIASIYMRGIKWTYFPTTYLGMVDSCIGGKSSINVGGVKNLVGNFYPPEGIYIDPLFLKSLPKEQVIAGCCEAIKICFAYPKDNVFENYVKLQKSQNIEKYEDIINLSLQTKKWFIEIDEFDQNERQLLNFGHCFGHAIEGACNFKIPHGIAVGYGMVWTLFLGQLIYSYDYHKIKRLVELDDSLKDLLVDMQEYFSVLKNIKFEDIYSCFQTDKKHLPNKYVCILPNKDGYLERTIVDKSDESVELLKSSFVEFLEVSKDEI